jgi:TetR/AcrR family transcriptional regulator, mexJK operon transcriptional repressor
MARSGEAPREEGRSARKRRAIIEAATTLFLRNGYQGTSMDEIAALAAVSKQTVYKNFSDKEGLFTEIVLGTTNRVDELFHERLLALKDTGDLEKDLIDLARRHATSVVRPEVMRLRRLVVGETDRFPELGRTYWERGPGRVLATLASCFERLAERGLLRLTDPALAANHFAYLVLSIPLDAAMFGRGEESLTESDLHGYADEGVRVFLAAYKT